MNPFESMQALGRSLGQGRRGDGLRLSARAGQSADGMSKAFGIWQVPDNAALEEARRSFEQSWSAAQDSRPP